jgi:hypothetical protein
VYRTGGEGASGSLVRLGRSPKSFTDICIDEAGLPLEQVAFTEGKLVTRRLAVLVDESPRLMKAMFSTGKPSVAPRQGGGSVRPVDPSSRPPGDFWELTAPPEGFERRGRYVVVPPQAGFDDPAQRAGIIAFTSDVWVRGIDVVVLEQGSTLGGTPPFGADRTRAAFGSAPSVGESSGTACERARCACA